MELKELRELRELKELWELARNFRRAVLVGSFEMDTGIWLLL